MRIFILILAITAITVIQLAGQEINNDAIAAVSIQQKTSYNNKAVNADTKETLTVNSINSRAQFNSNITEYLNKKIVYPELAQKNFVEGKVLAEVTIDAEGKVQDVVILKSLGFGCDEQVVKTLSEMPNWTPATRNGVSIPQTTIIPVQFRLQ